MGSTIFCSVLLREAQHDEQQQHSDSHSPPCPVVIDAADFHDDSLDGDVLFVSQPLKLIKFGLLSFVTHRSQCISAPEATSCCWQTKGSPLAADIFT